MADYQNIVDNIRGLIGGVDQTRSQELADLAASYSALCREANERLRRCADYVHLGLRTEALHLAEAQPALLDLVAALDMPELPEWENLCAMYDMPRPPRLLMEAAEELNEAYAADQPLQSLLAEHRVLALCRAPLRDRIALMREIAEADPTGAFWDDDLRTFEQARLREIHAEATTAIRASDANRITQLLAEVTSDGWRNAPTAELKQSLQRASAATRRTDGLRRLRELAPHLDVAYGAMSFEECAALLEEWNGVVPPRSKMMAAFPAKK